MARPQKKIKLKANGRVMTLDGQHEVIHIRPDWWTLAFIGGKKDELGFDLPVQEQFDVLDIAELRWKKSWFGDVLWFNVPNHNDPWQGMGKTRRRRPYKIRTSRKSRAHTIATQMAWAIHLSWLQQVGYSRLRGELPPPEPVPPTWFERAGAGIVAAADRIRTKPST